MAIRNNEDSPMVSICCITYNHEPYIADAIEGFLMQETEFDFEILIGDDCSEDGTYRIAKEYEKKNPERLRIITNAKNIGGRKNFRNLLEKAKGDYIAVCEGDDYWTDSQKLQKQIDFMEKNPDCGMCFHSAKVVSSMKIPLGLRIRPFKENHLCTGEEVIRIAGGKIPTQSKVYRKHIRENAPEWYMNAHAGDIATDLLFVTRGKIAYIDEAMSAYRLASKGSWSRRLYTGTHVLEKKTAMLNKDIELYEAFNEYTNYFYAEEIERMKFIIRCGICLLSGAGFKEKKRCYMQLKGSMGMKSASKMMIKYCLLIVFAKFQR